MLTFVMLTINTAKSQTSPSNSRMIHAHSTLCWHIPDALCAPLVTASTKLPPIDSKQPDNEVGTAFRTYQRTMCLHEMIFTLLDSATTFTPTHPSRPLEVWRSVQMETASRSRTALFHLNIAVHNGIKRLVYMTSAIKFIRNLCYCSCSIETNGRMHFKHRRQLRNTNVTWRQNGDERKSSENEIDNFIRTKFNKAERLPSVVPTTPLCVSGSRWQKRLLASITKWSTYRSKLLPIDRALRSEKRKQRCVWENHSTQLTMLIRKTMVLLRSETTSTKYDTSSETAGTMVERRRSEILAMNDWGVGLAISLLRNRHLLKGRQRREDRTANTHRIFTFRCCNYLDQYRAVKWQVICAALRYTDVDRIKYENKRTTLSALSFTKDSRSFQRNFLKRPLIGFTKTTSVVPKKLRDHATAT